MSGAGATDTSNTFVVQPGAEASLQWSTIPSPQTQNAPFTATLTAEDVNGYTATNFNGTASVSGWANGASVAPPPGTSIGSGNVQLLGSDLKLGINADGSMICQNLSLGANFLGNEYLLPGVPLASFSLAVNGSVFHNAAASGNSSSPIAMTVQNLSTANYLHAEATGAAGGINVVRDIWFQPNSDAVTFQVTLQNTTAAAENNVAWLENYDPDQGYGLTGDYATSNNVLLGGHYVEAVYYYSPTYTGGLTIAMGSPDSRGGRAQGFYVVNPFDVINSPGNPGGAKADITSNLAFNIGTLGAGGSTTFTYYIVFATDRASAESLYEAQLTTPVTVSPTTVTFVNGVWTGNVTVSQAANNIYLEANDGNGHVADSNLFNTIAHSVAPATPSLLTGSTSTGNALAKLNHSDAVLNKVSTLLRPALAAGRPVLATPRVLTAAGLSTSSGAAGVTSVQAGATTRCCSPAGLPARRPGRRPACRPSSRPACGRKRPVR